jgi:hypothetical protein
VDGCAQVALGGEGGEIRSLGVPGGVLERHEFEPVASVERAQLVDRPAAEGAVGVEENGPTLDPRGGEREAGLRG